MRSQKGKQIRPLHILIALVRREKTQAAQMLYLSGVDTNDLFTRTLENLQWEAEHPVKRKKEWSNTKLLDQFSEDLIMTASSMEPVIARDKEIDMVIGRVKINAATLIITDDNKPNKSFDFIISFCFINSIIGIATTRMPKVDNTDN